MSAPYSPPEGAGYYPQGTGYGAPTEYAPPPAGFMAPQGGYAPVPNQYIPPGDHAYPMSQPPMDQYPPSNQQGA